MENKTLFGKDTYNMLTTREPLTKDLPDKAQTLFSGHCFHNRSLHTFVKRRKLAWFGHVTRHDSPPPPTQKKKKRKNHPSGHHGGWATPWWAEEMLDGQHQRVGIPTRVSTAHKSLCRKDWKRICAELSLVSPRPPNGSRD